MRLLTRAISPFLPAPRRRRPWTALAAGVAVLVVLGQTGVQAQSVTAGGLAAGRAANVAAQPLVVRLPAPLGPPSTQQRPAGVLLTAAQQEPIEIPQPPEGIAEGERQDSGGKSLSEISEIALANSPAIREARNRAVAARGLAVQASLYPNPTVGTQSPQSGSQTQYNAYVIQDLVTKGKIGLDAAAAQRAAREAEYALVRARFDVLTMVRQRFYTALAMQQRVEVLDRMVTIARTSRDVGQRRLEAGIGPRSDVLLLQIELSKAEAELKNAHTLAETSRRQLAAATGLINLEIDRVDGDLKEPLPDYELAAAQQNVIARNALINSAQVEIVRSQFILRRAEVEPFPNLNFMGGYQNQIGPIDQNQRIFQVQMVIPLWNRNQGNIRAAQANVGTAVAQFNRVRTELANETAAALGRYLTAHQFAERYEKEILPSAVQVQGITAQLYRQGQVDFLRYLAAQRALLDASLSYISAQESRWVAAAEVAGLLQTEQFP